jgi:hypothetical protein
LQEAIEVMVACSAMALAKEEESKGEGKQSSERKWAKWKRGGIIGAAAITGGALMAVTGGMEPSKFFFFSESLTLNTSLIILVVDSSVPFSIFNRISCSSNCCRT